MADQFRLTEEQRALRDMVRKLADDRIAPFAAEVDAEPRFPQEAREALAGNGLLGLHIEQEYGGQGGDAVSFAILVEEVARACASSSLIPAVQKLGTLPIQLGASEEQKRAWLPPLAGGEEMISYCLSEADAGSDPASMTTRADRVADGWRLNGTKFWITNAGVSEAYTVLAKTDPDAGARGISAFYVRHDDEGLSFGKKEEKLGIRGSPTRAVVLEDCVIPEDRLVGEPGSGFKTFMGALDHSRPVIGAQAVGIAQAAIDVASGYVREREQFGRPIGTFQGVAFMLADMATQTEAARNLVYLACAATERRDPHMTRFASMAKMFASDVAMRVTTDGVQLLGGYGYVKEYPVERFMRDAKITQIYEGTNQIQRVVIARQLLGKL